MLMTFPSINPALDRALAARNYVTPTAVQLAVLQDGARHRDLLVSAQTGSGKTVAFGVSIAATLLLDGERLERAAEPLALIIAPTRELALQVERELSWLYAQTGAKIMTCVGGMDARAEARQLGFGAHIVVGTPGRLRDHIERKRLVLGKLKAIVLDEADEMLDLGFREDLEFILETTPTERRTLMFSATMPHDIEAMAKRYQRDALRIQTLKRDEQHADIDYRAIKVAANDVEKAVVNVLRYYEPRTSLVFCATRDSVKRLHARLVERGFSAVALSGELTQHERTQAMVAVRDGRARVMVATDVAARGLDLPDLALVIHSELPNDRETLLHRSGRTGRAGKKGMCILIVPFNRHRKADGLLGAARLRVTWAAVPTADAIRIRDQERFLADPIFTDAATESELAAAKALLVGRTADETALALVRLHRTRLPEPESFTPDTGPPRHADRSGSRERGDRPARARDDRPRSGGARGEDRPAGARYDGTHSQPPRARRDVGREMVWFRLNIGRDRNADPKWILPLICKAGGISKSEIGTIKINDRDTRFEIAADHAGHFAEAVRTNKNKEGHISRVGAHSQDDDVAVDAALRALPQPTAKPKTRDEHRPKKPWQKLDRQQNAGRTFADKKTAAKDRGPVEAPPRKGPDAAPPRKGPDAAPPRKGPDAAPPRKGPDARYLNKRKHRVA